MGVTLPTFTNGTTMVAADVLANATTVRDWMNGNSVVGDYAGTLPTYAFMRGDNSLWGGQTQHWMGPSGGYWFMQYSDDVSERVVIHPDSHGIVASGTGQFMDVSEFALRFKVPDAGYLNIEVTWWCWAIGSDQITPEALQQAEFKTYLDGNPLDGTRRLLWDCGTDTSVNQGGPMIYPARQHAVSARATISAGWHGVRVKVNLRNSRTKSEYPTIYVGARQMLVEYERK